MNITIFGKTGTGKSVLANNIIKHIRRDIPVIMITDNNVDFSDAKITLDIDSNNFRLLRFDKVVNAKRIRLLFGMMIQDEINEFLDNLSNYLYYNSIPSVLVIDEAHMIYGKRSHSKNLERLIRGGRKKHIHVIMITQQVVDLDLSAIKQSKYVIAFRVSELNDIERTAMNLQIPYNYLRTIPQYHYIVTNTYTGEIYDSWERSI